MSRVLPRFDRAAREALAAFRPRLARWQADHLDALRDARPDLPGSLNDRQRDICEPLLAIADEAGGEWPKRARVAVVKLCAASRTDDADVRERLLADVWAVFQAQRDVIFLSYGTICAALNKDELTGWAEWNKGRGIAPRDLSRKLRDFELVARQERDGAERPRGYMRSDVEVVIARYRPPAENKRDSVTSPVDEADSRDPGGVAPDRAGLTPRPLEISGCHAVTPESGLEADEERAAIMEHDGGLSGEAAERRAGFVRGPGGRAAP